MHSKRYAFIAWLCLAFASGGVSAESIPVNSPEDLGAVEAQLELKKGGKKCTVRWAVQAAFEDKPYGGCPAGNGADTLEFDVPAIRLVLGEIEIDSELFIDGGVAGVTLSGNEVSRIFNVTVVGKPVRMRGITFEQGQSIGDGGAIVVGDNSNLVLEDSTFKLNKARGRGGAVSSTGVLLVVRNSYFLQNKSQGTLQGMDLDGGGGLGGAINASGVVQIETSTFDENQATFGGGAVNCAQGIIELRENHFIRNYAFAFRVKGMESTQGGGALQSECTTSSTGNHYENNTAYGRGGGGILIGAGATYAWFHRDAIRKNRTENLPFAFENQNSRRGAGLLTFAQTFVHASVIEGNENTAGRGGGIAQLGGGEGRRLTVVNSEVVLNKSSFASPEIAGTLNGAGIYVGPQSYTTLVGSTVAWNDGHDQLYVDPSGSVAIGELRAVNTLVASNPGLYTIRTCGGHLQKFVGEYNRQSNGTSTPPTDCPTDVYVPANPAVMQDLGTWGGRAGTLPGSQVHFKFIRANGVGVKGEGKPQACKGSSNNVIFAYDQDLFGKPRPDPCTIGAVEP